MHRRADRVDQQHCYCDRYWCRCATRLKGYLECGDCGCRQSGPQELARDVGHRERLGAADSAADLSAAGRALAGRWQGERQDEQDEWNEQVKQGEQVEQAGQAEQDEQVSS